MIYAMPSIGQILSTFETRHSQRELFQKVKEGGPGKWRAIREIYKMQDERGYSPYFVDWPEIFTPIEYDAWQYIRQMGLPFYPQYPVGRFFIDFADPFKQIAIECDGRAYHNAEKDAERDRILERAGWSVYRFTGSSLVKDEDALGSARDQFREIARIHYGIEFWEERGED